MSRRTVIAGTAVAVLGLTAVLAVGVAVGRANDPQPPAATASPSPSQTRPPVTVIESRAETDPVASDGDAADDPAIWVNTADPAKSLVIGNDKRGALETYDLSGRRVQRLSDAVPFWGNVDVRGDLVAVYHDHGVQVYKVDPATRQLSNATEGTSITTGGEGLCLYASARPKALYVFVIGREAPSQVRQFEIVDADRDGRFEGVERRTFAVESESEGCAVDDVNGALYISEEDTGVWRYAAAADAEPERKPVDTLVAHGGWIRADAEGVTVAGDRVIVSAQNGQAPNRSYFTMYDRKTNAFVGAFRVGDGKTSDDCDGTDGIAAYAGALGPDYPDGLFVCQDGTNQEPSENQDFKYVRWGDLP